MKNHSINFNDGEFAIIKIHSLLDGMNGAFV